MTRKNRLPMLFAAGSALALAIACNSSGNPESDSAAKAEAAKPAVTQAVIDRGHRYFRDSDWNHVRLVARGPRMQTWVNGQPVEDLVNEAVYGTHPEGFIALQIHGEEGRGPFRFGWR